MKYILQAQREYVTFHEAKREYVRFYYMLYNMYRMLITIEHII